MKVRIPSVVPGMFEEGKKILYAPIPGNIYPVKYLGESVRYAYCDGRNAGRNKNIYTFCGRRNGRTSVFSTMNIGAHEGLVNSAGETEINGRDIPVIFLYSASRVRGDELERVKRTIKREGLDLDDQLIELVEPVTY